MADQEENQVPEIRVETPAEGDDLDAQEAKVGEEFKELSRQLVRAMRAVAGSEEVRHLGNEILSSLREIGDEVQKTFERTREKEEIRAVGEQAKRVTRAVASGIPAKEATSDVQGNLTRVLRSLNEELNKLIDQVQARSARMSEEVEGTAHEAGTAPEATREQVEEAWEGSLDEAAASSDQGPGAEAGASTLEEAWEQPTTDAANVGEQTEGGENEIKE